MAKSHPELLDARAGHPMLRTRNARVTVTLVASLVSLNVVWSNVDGIGPHGVATHDLEALDVSPPAAEVPPAAPVVDRKQQALGAYLARRFRVSTEMTTDVVANAYSVGAKFKLDPMLILAVIAVESRFNPVAQSVGGAKGLMQVIPRFHTEKFEALGGEKAAFDLQANILVGAKILHEYIRRTGDVAEALQLYVGAGSDENEKAYSDKVIAERERLNEVLKQFQSRSRSAERRTPAPPATAPG